MIENFKQIEKIIIGASEEYFGEKIIRIRALPMSGSARRYYRVRTESNKTLLGVYNEDSKENTAYLSFSKDFLAKNLRVPEIFYENEKENIYLVEDLGDVTLYSFITDIRKEEKFPQELIDIYKKVIDNLVKFQLDGGEAIDYSVCYPRNRFDKQSMMWDLNYFKYYFLKLAGVVFDEQNLEDDYIVFCDYLLQAGCDNFMYRDFQSRNIMIKDGEPYFIDFQGGRKGALQYDLASLLFDAKVNMPNDARELLLKYYIEQLSKIKDINKEEFKKFYYGYVLIRIMQAMGAYGYRGFYEQKKHFLQSIPYAIKNLEWLLENNTLEINTPTLKQVLTNLVKSEKIRKIGNDKISLNVAINSFSYKRGVPIDISGNGGGFVFDCRAIHNPGRYEEYKELTGMDKPVIDFLEKGNEMSYFLVNVRGLVDKSVQTYMKRNFTNLQINFGCTGGQHRSVYAAENMTKYLKNKYNLEVVLNHLEQN